MDDFVDFPKAIAAAAGLTVAFLALALGVVVIDYFVSAESTVRAVNAQCDAQYQKLDYLTIGKGAMLQLCEIRQKRVEIK